MSPRPGRAPQRLVEAVRSIAVRPSDRLLELGCGRGVAAGLVGDALGDGGLLGIDRSDTAITAARERNRDAVTRGRLAFRRLTVEDMNPAELGRFDTVFAVNVNLFWTRPAQHELGLVAGLLRPGGHLWLFYDPPTMDGVRRLEGLLAARLDRAGYEYRAGTTAIGDTMLLSLAARPVALVPKERGPGGEAP
jgi:SAM-dependent methyltransferase